MNMKISLMALGAIGLMTLGGGQDSYAAEDKKDQSKPKEDHKVVKIKAGDTLSSIAKDHDTTYVKIFNANETIANPDAIDIGDKVKIPKKGDKLPDRYGKFRASVAASAPTAAPVAAAGQQVVAQTATSYTTRSYSSTPVNSTSYYVGNGMWCTDWVHAKRPDVPIYGNAGMSWIGAAQSQGKSTGTTPKAGAVAVMDGHVAYVESVNSDGSYVVSEMGWNYQQGNFNQRTVQPGAFGGFIY